MLADALSLWARLAGAQIRSQMQYRASFAIQSAVMFGVMVSDLAPVWILSRFFGSLDGWSFAELALLYGMVETSWASVETVLRGFENFSVYLIQGDLDRILLRPRSVILQVATRDFDARKLSRIAQGLLVLAIACFALGLDARALGWVALGVAGGTLCFAGIVMAGAALQFWTLGQAQELQNVLTYGGAAAMTYPVSIYAKWFRRVLTYGVPLAFVNYFPALAALDRTEAAGVPGFVPWLSPLVCAAVLALGMAAFARGLRRYESTGS
ncbi:MAG: ABC transporter permease [Deltaproteobacteria bacterium]|nr:ABC transporter permease [Deltaproteobacteria bacterium]